MFPFTEEVAGECGPPAGHSCWGIKSHRTWRSFFHKIQVPNITLTDIFRDIYTEGIHRFGNVHIFTEKQLIFNLYQTCFVAIPSHWLEESQIHAFFPYKIDLINRIYLCRTFKQIKTINKKQQKLLSRSFVCLAHKISTFLNQMSTTSVKVKTR